MTTLLNNEYISIILKNKIINITVKNEMPNEENINIIKRQWIHFIIYVKKILNFFIYLIVKIYHY